MSFEGVPWMIDGGTAKHSADVARQFAYDATQGATGVSRPRDLQVRALPQPGPAVRIMPGGGPIENTYRENLGQSYIVRNPGETTVTVPSTGSTAGAVSYVIVRIDDPQFNGGQVPADPVNGPYVYPELVPSLEGLDYPFMALAKITQPINNAAIDQGMIEDLRKVANPRTLDVVRVAPIVTGDTGLVLGAGDSNGEWFPNSGGNQDVDIPYWATRAQIRAYWTQIKYEPNKNPSGQYWVEYGPYSSAQNRERTTQRFRFDSPAVGNYHRANWIMADDVYIPAAYRDTLQKFVMKATYTSASDGVLMDASSGVFMEIRFLEVADPSTS